MKTNAARRFNGNQHVTHAAVIAAERSAERKATHGPANKQLQKPRIQKGV